MRSGCVVQEDSEYCGRGLELSGTFQPGVVSRIRSRISAREAVLKEQARQRSQGLNDPEYLSLVYYAASHHSRVTANSMALQDENKAKSLHAEGCFLEAPIPVPQYHHQDKTTDNTVQTKKQQENREDGSDFLVYRTLPVPRRQRRTSQGERFKGFRSSWFTFSSSSSATDNPNESERGDQAVTNFVVSVGIMC